MLPLSEIFAALGDPVRFSIVERLLAEGEVAAGDLVSGSGITAPAISRHLSVLRDAGLVQSRAEAQRRLYSVRPDSLQTIARWTMDHREFWESSVARLDALMALEEKK